MKPLSIIGVPVHAGQPKQGVECSPDEMRKHGLVNRLKRLGVKVEDTGNLEIPNPIDDPIKDNMKHPKAIGMGSKMISDSVQREVKKGNNVLVLGGDHSIEIGTVHGHMLAKEEKPILVWIDAHCDINTSVTSPSGNAHGMPVSFLLEEMRHSVPKSPEFDWLSATLKGKDVVFIGIRDVDSGEVEVLRKHGIKYFSMQEVDAYGVRDVLRNALYLTDPSGKRPIHVSFDVDSMDPMFTPSTCTPVPGGLTLRECLYMAEILNETNRLSVVDIVELNISLGSETDKARSLASTLKVIEHFFGNKRAGVIIDEECAKFTQEKKG